MDFVDHDIDTLTDRHLAADQPELVRFFILKIMRESKTNIGAWELQLKLAEMGVNLSTATIGRYLKILDNEQLTVKVSNKGRTLTPKGERVYEDRALTLTSDILHRNMREAVNQTGYRNLLDIYTVRKSIELEAVRLCCRNATEKTLTELDENVAEYRRLVHAHKDFTDVSLRFHIILSEATNNRFMDALLKLLIFEQKKIETEMEIVETRNFGLQYADEHEELVNYIRDHNEEKAVACLERHLCDIIKLVEIGADTAPERR